VRDAKSLGQFARTTAADRRMVFAVVSRHSAQAHLIQSWLATASLLPDIDVDIVVIPPPQMIANLQAGHIDGFCAGEPYNSEAVARNIGWVATTSTQLAPFHPEKVLVTRQQLVDERSEEHLAMLAAILDACEYCDDPSHHDEVSEVLAQSHYLNMSAEVIRRGWPGSFDCGQGRIMQLPDLNIFHRDNANEPSADKAAWVVRHLLSDELRMSFPPVELGRVFRTDLYAAALETRNELVPA
jgi:ABC-type nitrate/sulfonate/bicarbonate transport system substrate-binding protein